MGEGIVGSEETKRSYSSASGTGVNDEKNNGSVLEFHGVTSHMRSIRSQHAGEVNYINSAASNTDKELLAEIGYKQELKRRFSTIQVFGVAFSIMGLLPSIGTLLSDGIAGGPVSTTWGWFISGFFILVVGLAMAENASAIPTAGGLYYWTYYYAPKGYKAVTSFIIGCTNSLALTAACCSITYGFAEEVLAAVVLTNDGNFDVTNGKLYGIYAGAAIVMGLCTCLASGFVARLQTLSIISNLFIIVLLFIALPIGTKVNRGKFNHGEFIFGKYQNFSDWNDGWQFCLAGFMPAIWTIGAFDSCVHQSEEAKDAKKSVPLGIVGSIGACWILGWLIMIVLLACMDPDLSKTMDTNYVLAIAQIIYDCLGKKWAIGFMSLIAFCQFLMGASTVTAISRQIWAFSRDDGLPLSKYVKMVNKTYCVPFVAVIAACCGTLILGLLCLQDEAANALFSLAVAGNNLSWATPTFLRLTFGKDLFTPGPFYLGKFLSPINGWVSIFWGMFTIILVMFPTTQHGVTYQNMNYACVIGPGVWILSFIYYITYKKKYYNGPASNLTDEEYVDAIGEDGLDNIDNVLSQPEKAA